MSDFGLGIEKLKNLLSSCVHIEPPIPGRGFQQDLGPSMETHLLHSLANGAGLVQVNPAYSPRLNEQGDLAFRGLNSDRRLYFEIEFRPNVEKDLVKFQIGANTGQLAAAVLILALNRNCVNPGYTTMPEFAKFERVIDELRPQYPLIMLGFAGEHRDS